MKKLKYSLKKIKPTTKCFSLHTKKNLRRSTKEDNRKEEEEQKKSEKVEKENGKKIIPPARIIPFEKKTKKNAEKTQHSKRKERRVRRGVAKGIGCGQEEEEGEDDGRENIRKKKIANHAGIFFLYSLSNRTPGKFPHCPSPHTPNLHNQPTNNKQTDKQTSQPPKETLPERLNVEQRPSFHPPPRIGGPSFVFPPDPPNTTPLLHQPLSSKKEASASCSTITPLF